MKYCKFSAVSKQILQVNMRLTAFFKLYKICILLHRCNLKILAKNRFNKSNQINNLIISVKIEPLKIQQKFANVAKSARSRYIPAARRLGMRDPEAPERTEGKA